MIEIQTVNKLSQVESLLIDQQTKEKVQSTLVQERTLLCASTSDQVIGFALIEYNEFHPYWARPLIYVAPEHRRMGYGSKLYQQLIQDPLPGKVRGFECGADSKDIQLKSFLRSNCFKKILDCHCIQFKLSDVDEPCYDYVSECGLQLCSFSDAETILLNVHEFLSGAYTRDHKWSLPVPRSSELWLERFATFDPDYSFVIHDGVSVKSCISSRVSNNISDIWWLYSDFDSNDNLQKFLLSYLAKICLERGIYTADIELDSTKSNFLELKQFIPVEHTDIWQVYQHPLA